MKRKHADLAIEYFSDDSVEIQFKNICGEWVTDNNPIFNKDFEYRKKQKLVKYRIASMRNNVGPGKYIDIEVEIDGVLEKLSFDQNFIEYKTDWIEIEI